MWLFTGVIKKDYALSIKVKLKGWSQNMQNQVDLKKGIIESAKDLRWEGA